MQVRREVEEIPGMNPQISGCSSNDTESESLSCTLPSMTSMVKQEAHTYPYGSMDILRCFKWGTRGSIVDPVEDAWEKVSYCVWITFYWILLKCMHRMERMLESVWHE